MRHFLILGLFVAALAPGISRAQDTLTKIKSSGVITLGVRESSSPLSYAIADGIFGGFHVDVCNRIVADLRKQLGGKLEARFQPVTLTNRIPLTTNGTVDLECGNTANNTARQRDVAFAVTTYIEQVRVAVKASSSIKSINQLNGKTVATTTGLTLAQTLRKDERAKGVDFKEVFGKDNADTFMLLVSSHADAIIMDGSTLAKNIADAKNPSDFRVLGEVLSAEPIAIMIRKDDPNFEKAVNDSIKAMMKSGELAKIYDKWFMQPIPPISRSIGMPLSAALKEAWTSPNNKPKEDYYKNGSGTDGDCKASCGYCCTRSDGSKTCQSSPCS